MFILKYDEETDSNTNAVSKERELLIADVRDNGYYVILPPSDSVGITDVDVLDGSKEKIGVVTDIRHLSTKSVK